MRTAPEQNAPKMNKNYNENGVATLNVLPLKSPQCWFIPHVAPLCSV